MKFQISRARGLLASLSVALLLVLAGPAGMAVAQVVVLLPTDGDLATIRRETRVEEIL